MAFTFKEVEIYRAKESLEGRSRAWCEANLVGQDVEPTLYQAWAGYPDSPVLTSDWKYQVIYDENYNGTHYYILYVCQSPMYVYGNNVKTAIGSASKSYYIVNGNWAVNSTLVTTGDVVLRGSAYIYTPIEANAPIYTDATLTTVYFAQTTTPAPTPITTKIYTGALEAYSDTGLTELTHYYYKLFAVYEDGAELAYSSGVCADAVSLETPSLYQEWDGYPDSPVLTSEYPYQFISYKDGYKYLYVSSSPFYYKYLYSTYHVIMTSGLTIGYKIDPGSTSWLQWSTYTADRDLIFVSELRESNRDIYTNNLYNTVYFAKTT